MTDLTREFEVRFSGLVIVKAKDSKEAWESVSNEMILDNINLDDIQEMTTEQDTIKYKCPECKEVAHWSTKDFAAKGEPVCPYDGTDMDKE